MKTFSISILFTILLLPYCLLAQTPLIYLDGEIEDWETATQQYVDTSNDGQGIDFLDCKISNDADFLFIQLQLKQEIKITERSGTFLYLDGDNDATTGFSISGLGAELVIDLGGRKAYTYLNDNNIPNSYRLSAIQFRNLPTVSSTIHEIAIARHLQFNNKSVFTGSKIAVFFQDLKVDNGDKLPNSEEIFTYTINEETAFEATAIPLERENNSHLRLFTYNILQNGITNNGRAPRIARLLRATNPDLITFNECWQVSSTQATNFLNKELPLNSGDTWHCTKKDDGNITASRYPILQTWLVASGRRITAALIDLPNALYSKDLLLVNAHFKCCGGDSEDEKRQREADAFASFILDAKTEGGRIDLPEGTPFILSGDLNLVGDAQQLRTVLTGNIVNTGTYGAAASLDWDDSDLQDVISIQTDHRMAYTWRNDDSSFPPGRLDFTICSNSVMQVEKAYTLQTEVMTDERLEHYNLQKYDTRSASDHFPKITDFSILNETTTSVQQITPTVPTNLVSDLQLSPNPFDSTMQVKFTLKQATQNATITVYDIQGKASVQQRLDLLPSGEQALNIDTNYLQKGVYWIVLNISGRQWSVKGVRL